MEFSYIVGRIVKWYNHSGKHLAVSENVKRYNPEISLLENWKYMSIEILYTNVHSRIIFLKEEAFKMFISSWMDKQMWYMHTKEYYLVIKKEWNVDT